jgi:serine/threonine-protein kinase
VTRSGALIFHTGEARNRLVWVDRNGTITPAFDEPRAFDFLRLSPDGRRAALVIATGATSDVWVLDLAGGTLARVTSIGQARSVAWSADGRQVFFVSTHGGRAEFWWQSADGSGEPVKAGTPPHNPWWADLSPDRRTVVYNALFDGSWKVEAQALDARHEVQDLMSSPLAGFPRYSPDGAWVAYSSTETGREEIYVRPASQTGGRAQVSVNGGRRPIWSADGRELFFREGGQVISATLARDPSIRVVSRQRLFGGDFDPDFDVSKDGRFLMVQREPVGLSLVVVPDWRAELRRLTGAK